MTWMKPTVKLFTVPFTAYENEAYGEEMGKEFEFEALVEAESAEQAIHLANALRNKEIKQFLTESSGMFYGKAYEILLKGEAGVRRVVEIKG